MTMNLGGYPKFVDEGLNDNYLPVWLQEAGYATYYVGKLFNAHSILNYFAPFANGWTGSVGSPYPTALIIDIQTLTLKGIPPRPVHIQLQECLASKE